MATNLEFMMASRKSLQEILSEARERDSLANHDVQQLVGEMQNTLAALNDLVVQKTLEELSETIVYLRHDDGLAAVSTRRRAVKMAQTVLNQVHR